MIKNPVRLILAVGAFLIGVVIFLYIDNSTIPVGEKPKRFADLGGQFELNSAEGAVALDNYKGQVVVLYFGFLNCAEVCPSSMGVMSAAFSQLPERVYDDVQGLFISVDPQRDDLESLHAFAQHFDKRILGLTGTSEEIETLTNQYGVYYDLVDMEQSVLDYTVDHVSRFYVIAPDGKLIDSMSHSTTPTELAARIERTIDSYNAAEESVQ